MVLQLRWPAERRDWLLFVNVEIKRLICVGSVNERDSVRLCRHVQEVIVGTEQLRTEQLGVYDKIVPKDFRKICLAYWRKSKCRRTWQLYRQLKAEGLKFEASYMLKLLELLNAGPRPPRLPEAHEALVRRYTNCRRGLLWNANQLLQHIWRTWKHISSEGSGWTNNVTERIIRLNYKIRARTMRGSKSWPKILGHCCLSGYLRGVDGMCDL